MLMMTNDGDIIPVAPYELVERIRASINVLGPLLDRFGDGAPVAARWRRLRRPADRHALARARGDGRDVRDHPRLRRRARAIGCTAPTSPSSSPASAPPRTSSPPAVHAKGTTVIDNAAREPEIADLCAMLSRWVPTSRVSARRRSSSTVSNRARSGRRSPHRRRPHPGRHVPGRGRGHWRRALPARVRAPSTWRTCCADSSTWVSTSSTARRPDDPRRSGACARSTWPRCRTRASPPTTSH